jgi:hypothetical protein
MALVFRWKAPVLARTDFTTLTRVLYGNFTLATPTLDINCKALER